MLNSLKEKNMHICTSIYLVLQRMKVAESWVFMKVINRFNLLLVGFKSNEIKIKSNLQAIMMNGT